MITDKLLNIDKYPQVPDIAVDFVNKIRTDINLGKISLCNDIYVNVEEYNTKKLSEAKFESHNKYIDVQILLCGKEEIYIAQKTDLSVDVPYDTTKDIEFYSESVSDYQKILLDGTNFAVLFPHEAHAPQVAVNNKPKNVKKVVIKIKI